MTNQELTLRDHFAMSVAPTITEAVLRTAADHIEERIANATFQIADALVKKRNEHATTELAQETPAS